MTRFPLLPAALAAAVLALAAGCSTIESRIEQNRDYFDALPAADQAQIRIGKIDLGFTPESVRMALGEPRRKTIRRTASGDSEIWTYTDTTQSYDRQHADIDGLSYAGPGGGRITGGSAWITLRQDHENLSAIVEFRHGRVSAIEVPAADAAKKLADTAPASPASPDAQP
jgi:hypothetical protein